MQITDKESKQLMQTANDNTIDPTLAPYPCYVLFFDSDDDEAFASHTEGPFATYNAAIEYTIGAYAYAKEHGLEWTCTEIVPADQIEEA